MKSTKKAYKVLKLAKNKHQQRCELVDASTFQFKIDQKFIDLQAPLSDNFEIQKSMKQFMAYQ